MWDPELLKTGVTLATPCCHHGVSIGHIAYETGPLPGATHDIASQRDQLLVRKGLQRRERTQRQCGDSPADIPGGAVDGNQLLHGPNLGTPERPESSEAIQNHHGKITFS